MRVLHFAHSFIPQYGGTTTRLINLLADPQHEHWLTVHYPSRKALPSGVQDLPSSDRYDNVEVRRVDITNLGILGKVPIANVHVQSAALQAAVAEVEVDLVHGHNPTGSALASCAAAKRRDIPLVYEAHGIMHNYSNLPRPFGPLQPLNQMAHAVMRATIARYERHILFAAKRIIVQTEASRDYLKRLYGLESKPFDIISNGVDPTKFDPSMWSTERDSLRQERAWEDKTVCLYAGYLDRVNGVDQLLEVISGLDSQVNRRLRFVFAGRGPHAEMVQKAAKDHDSIEFLGLVDYARMPGLVAASDVFVIPRPPVLPAETFRPMKLLEAMAMEKLLLVSNVAAMAELIHHEENGLLYQKGNANALRAALVRISERPAEFAKLGAHARRDVLERHTWQAARQKLDHVYAAAQA